MALDLNSANIITEGLERHGGWYLSALLILVVVWQALVARKDRTDAHKEVIAALERVMPLAASLVAAIAAVKGKGRRPGDSSPPAPSVEVVK